MHKNFPALFDHIAISENNYILNKIRKQSADLAK